jgi:branched-chain amino acid transport system substrate-binding protein
MYKGHPGCREINAKGGLLGKRKIETIKADENAGADANVGAAPNGPRKIDFFTGITSNGNTPARARGGGLKLLTIFVDSCTDFLFDRPYRTTTSSASRTSSRPTASHAPWRSQTWPQARKIAHIHPTTPTATTPSTT